MTDFGAQLKAARESRSIPLRQIAAATKISVSALEALERNDFSRLPGGIFSRAFVRAYAVEVGLDPEQTVETFLEEFERADVKPLSGPRPEVTADDRAFLARQQRAGRVLRALLIALVLAGAGGIVVWKYRSSFQSATNPGVPPPLPTTEGRVPGPAPAAPILTAPAPVQTAPTAVTSAGQPDQIAVHLEITQNCWVRARVDGTIVFEQTLHAGDKRDLKANADVYLQVENGGAVTWTINGQPAKDLGPPGQSAYAHLTSSNLGKFLK